jgi:Icc-related predicted phosphoesterase
VDHAQAYTTVLENLKLELISGGDLHGEARKFKMYARDVMAEPRCQLVIASGDYLPQPEFDREKAVSHIEPLIEILREIEKPILLLGGNYDPFGAATMVAEKFGEPFFSIGAKRVEQNPPGNNRDYYGYSFVGCEGTNPINGRFPGERSEEDLRNAFQSAMKDLRHYDPYRAVFVTHAPPFECGGRDELGKFGLPQPYWGKHVGSTALREILYQYKPLLLISGHIHEGVGATVYEWREQAPAVTDVRMRDTPNRILIVMEKDGKTKQSVVVNHGTLEYWDYFRYRVAEVGNLVLLDVCKRRLGGKDPLTKMLDRVSGKGSKVIYNQIFDPDNALTGRLQ